MWLENSATNIGATAFGSFNNATGINSSAYGQQNLVTNKQDSAFGFSNSVSGAGSTALGNNNNIGDDLSTATNSASSTAVGIFNTVLTGDNNTSGSIAIGDRNSVAGQGDTVIGSRNIIGNVLTSTAYQNGVVVGITSRSTRTVGSPSATARWPATPRGLPGAEQTLSPWAQMPRQRLTTLMALGANSIAANANAIALGANSRTAEVHTGSYTITGGVAAGGPRTANGSLSIGQPGQERQIQNVALGVLSASSTDAVNGSQLYAVGTSLNTTAAGAARGLGGGAAWNAATGAWTAPVYTVNGTTVTDAGSAIAAVSAGANNVGATAAAALGGGSVYAPGAGLSAPSYVVQGTAYNNVGSAITAVNVNANNLGVTTAAALGGGSVYAPGVGTSAPSYVIQGSTYNNVGSAFGAVNNGLNNLQGQVSWNQREARQGIAMAAAMATAPMPSAAGRTSWKLNSAYYKDNGAISLSFAHRLPTALPFALTGGASVGYRNSAIFAVGLQGEF